MVKNDERARELLTHSASGGYAPAALFLGSGIANGFGGQDEDRTAAMEWAKRAHEMGLRELAEDGNAHAQRWLAASYEFGAFMEKNEGLVEHWLTKAAEQGYYAAQDELAKWFRGRQNKAKAARWYMKAALQGVGTAQYSLATLHHDGTAEPFLPKDQDLAQFWLQKCAAQGNTQLQTKANRMLQNVQKMKQEKQKKQNRLQKQAENRARRLAQQTPPHQPPRPPRALQQPRQIQTVVKVPSIPEGQWTHRDHIRRRKMPPPVDIMQGVYKLEPVSEFLESINPLFKKYSALFVDAQLGSVELLIQLDMDHSRLVEYLETLGISKPSHSGMIAQALLRRKGVPPLLVGPPSSSPILDDMGGRRK